MLKKLFTILILCLASLTLVGSTYAGAVSQYFKDTETSTGNSFSATTLDFSLSDTSNNPLAAPLINITNMIPGDSQTKTIRINKDGLDDFTYQLSATQTGGDTGLCTALKIEAKLDTVSQYNGSLTGLNLNPAATISGSEDTWDFVVKLDNSDSALQEKSCAFDIEIKGWQIGSNGTWGLNDTETLTNTVTTGCWAAPITPILASPLNGTYSTNPDQTFSWNLSTSSCPSATVEYQYKAYTDPTLTTLYHDSGWIGSTSETITGMTEQTYYWQVQAKDQYAHISSSSVWSLVIPHVVTVRLFPTADARLSEENPMNNSGASTSLTVKSLLNKDIRSILRFDLSTLPSTSQISSANLNLYLFEAPTTTRTNDVHVVTDHSTDWNEGNNDGTLADPGEVAWNWYANPESWTSGGGDINPVSTSSVSTGTTDNVWKTWDVTSNTADLTPYSWIVKDSVEDNGVEKKTRYYSSEETSINHDPYLDVTFAAPAMTTGHVVVNEVYYDVGAAKGAENTNEWVELYNPTDGSIDISGWSICDNTSCSVIPASTPVPNHGFAIITPNASTWGFWTVPAEAIQIVLGTSIGNGLNNTNDRVILRDTGLTTVDQMSYGTDTTVFDLPYVREGWSLARLLKGFDDDSASNFWANKSPNPGTNPDKTDSSEDVVQNVISLNVFSLQKTKEVGFRITGEDLSQFDSFAYTISYDCEQGQQGIMGEKKIEGKNDIEVNNLLLGTCSSGGTCVYHSGISKVMFEVKLKGQDSITLEKELSL